VADIPDLQMQHGNMQVAPIAGLVLMVLKPSH